MALNSNPINKIESLKQKLFGEQFQNKLKTFITSRAFLLGSFLLFLNACEKDVSDKIKLETTNQLVVTSFISPQDSVLLVHLQRTQPAVGLQFNQEELKVKDATVTLSDGNKTINLKYDTKRNNYRAKNTELPIIAGKTYFLLASTPNGWKATGTATVPTIEGIKLGLHSFRTEDMTSGGQNIYAQLILNFTWQDAPNISNFYRLIAYRKATIHRPGSTDLTHQQSFDRNYNNYLDSFRTDDRQDGEEIESGDLYTTIRKPDHFPRPHQLYLTLFVTDKAYYLYHQLFYKQNSNGDNPFAEPTLLYTNITGGLGVFSAYNQIHEVRQVN